MADKAISELIAAEQITATDNFVLEQNGTAKRLTGQVLLNWLTKAADGHGGIKSIAKLSTSGLADTYRITLADTTIFDFVVTNGRGISKIEKTTTEGLVDTYTITYNDGTTDPFNVTNGAKGDKGDNQYVWIKYASQKPTESSHSFGDVVDNWIGVYSGDSATAPTDWMQYEWFQIKGEKGETGDPASLTSSAVEYQVSDSGTIIPSGAWSASVPVVAQGKYLWTRTTNNFNTGSPVVSYSVSRMGLDGSGSVSSVANISPDENGNVQLSASDVGALSNAGGDLTGELKMNGQPVSGLNAPTADDHAANMGFVNQQMKKAAPRNLLDNSDFTNPVNQRGKTSYTGVVYGIDRWKGSNSAVTVTVADNGIKINSGTAQQAIQQNFPVGTFSGKKLTVAICDADGNIFCGTSEFPSAGEAAALSNNNGDVLMIFDARNNVEAIRIGLIANASASKTFAWAAMYEGEYTVDTLPEYQPKGYGAELAECQRYYIRIAPGYAQCGFAMVTSATSAEERFFIPLPTSMRVVPTVTMDDITLWRCASSNGVIGLSSVNAVQMASNGINVMFKLVSAPGKGMISLFATAGGTSMHISADL